jgi:galactose mutarotase-like enzyme
MKNSRCITINNRAWNIVAIANKNGSIQVAPEAGFSLVSFKWNGRELLELWDLAAFLGSDADLTSIDEKAPDIFRKGFGPSIGPWFGPRSETEPAYFQHGVCRFANWQDVTVSENSITGRLDGKKDKINGKTLNEICGFDFSVEISFMLTGTGLDYRIKNFSAGGKGTFGIHWYWKNPADTEVRLQVDAGKFSPDATTVPLTNGEIIGENCIFNQAFPSASTGLARRKGAITYADGSGIDFYYDDAFAITVLFNRARGICFEPVSGPAKQVGMFKEGLIRMTPHHMI